MKILFISHYSSPHVGGVEKHIEQVKKELSKLGHGLKVVSGSNVINYPKIKSVGLFSIWFQLFKKRKLIKDSDIVHIHDVFVWYLPFVFLYPNKKVFTTFHGGQDVWPVPLKHRLYVKIAEKLSKGTIAVGHFIKKHYNIDPDYVIYGAVNSTRSVKQFRKTPNTVLWLGRLDKNTDLLKFLKWLEKNNKLKVTFLGDGELRNECKKYGKVLGFVSNPSTYLKKTETVVPVGYLSYLEAKKYGCRIKTFPETPIKKDYWKGISRLKKIPTWKDLTMRYLRLWRVK